MTTKVSISVSRNRDEKKAFLGVVFFFPFLALQEEAEIKENDFFHGSNADCLGARSCYWKLLA